MFSSLWWVSRLVLSSVCLFGFLSQVAALDIEYCSDFNTASTNKNSSIYQSNGLCYHFCIANYAFAVIQNDGCWCSNYAPASTANGCTKECPGYPGDICGGNGVYGYIALSQFPSGTKGVDGTASSTSSQHVSTVTETSDSLTAVIPLPSSSTSSTLTSETSSSSTSASETPETTAAPEITESSTSESASSTWTPTPVISLETVTGQVRTVTVTPTIPPNSQNLNPNSKDNSDSLLGPGEAVGLTIGLIAQVMIVCSIVYFCLKKRRGERLTEEFNNVSRGESMVGLGGMVPSMPMSENSRYVLGTDGRQVVETWESDTQNTPGSRKSRLIPVDPRLDPFAPVYQRGESKSRESVNTIRDHHDYSRRVHQIAPILRATNPDE